MKKKKKEIAKFVRMIEDTIMCDKCKDIVSISTRIFKLKNNEKCIQLRITYKEN